MPPITLSEELLKDHHSYYPWSAATEHRPVQRCNRRCSAAAAISIRWLATRQVATSPTAGEDPIRKRTEAIQGPLAKSCRAACHRVPLAPTGPDHFLLLDLQGGQGAGPYKYVGAKRH